MKSNYRDNLPIKCRFADEPNRITPTRNVVNSHRNWAQKPYMSILRFTSFLCVAIVLVMIGSCTLMGDGQPESLIYFVSTMVMILTALILSGFIAPNSVVYGVFLYVLVLVIALTIATSSPSEGGAYLNGMPVVSQDPHQSWVMLGISLLAFSHALLAWLLVLMICSVLCRGSQTTVAVDESDSDRE